MSFWIWRSRGADEIDVDRVGCRSDLRELNKCDLRCLGSEVNITLLDRARLVMITRLVVSSPVVVKIQPTCTYPHGPPIYVTNAISGDVDCDDTSAYDAINDSLMASCADNEFEHSTRLLFGAVSIL